MSIKKILQLPKKILLGYLLLSGLFINLLFLGVYVFDRGRIYQLVDKIETKYKLALNPNALIEEKANHVKNLDAEIISAFGHWKPKIFSTETMEAGKVKIGYVIYDSISEASKNLKDNDTMLIGEGVYQDTMIIKANNVTIIGIGKVLLDGVAVNGKGAILTYGHDINIKNIECRHIKVRDGNGACVRAEGKNLHLEHVYFHDSQEGLLSGNHTGVIKVKDSRFEKLGKDGQSHGIYVGSGVLIIEDSLFIAAVTEGHEIKSRARKTIIRNTIVTSMTSIDSRLIDVPAGGELIIDNCILHQGKYSANYDMIGFGFEKKLHDINTITITNSIILLERDGTDIFINYRNNVPKMNISKNVIISDEELDIEGFNYLFRDRKEINYKPYPFFPKLMN